MAASKEIEYKFLIPNLAALNELNPTRIEGIVQAYLTKPGEGAAIRVRASIWENGHSEAFITVKGPAVGMTRDEYEYEIPVADAHAMMPLADGRTIQKTRYFFEHGAHTIEVDIFDGALQGLVMAEIEVKSEDEVVVFPDWFGENVTFDNRYTNIHLALHGLPTDSSK